MVRTWDFLPYRPAVLFRSIPLLSSIFGRLCGSAPPLPQVRNPRLSVPRFFFCVHHAFSSSGRRHFPRPATQRLTGEPPHPATIFASPRQRSHVSNAATTLDSVPEPNHTFLFAPPRPHSAVLRICAVPPRGLIMFHAKDAAAPLPLRSRHMFSNNIL